MGRDLSERSRQASDPLPRLSSPLLHQATEWSSRLQDAVAENEDLEAHAVEKAAAERVFVIGWEEWVDIVSLHDQGLSIRVISARLGVSRNTVRTALRRDGPPVRASRILPSKLDPYKDYLLSLLAEFPELSAARNLTGANREHDSRVPSMTIASLDRM